MTPKGFKKIRTALGYSQEQFAKELKTSQAAVCRYETGKQPITAGIEARMLLIKMGRHQM